jgi:hypothetical protein
MSKKNSPRPQPFIAFSAATAWMTAEARNRVETILRRSGSRFERKTVYSVDGLTQN